MTELSGRFPTPISHPISRNLWVNSPHLLPTNIGYTQLRCVYSANDLYSVCTFMSTQASSEAHLAENVALFDFTLTPAEIAELAALPDQLGFRRFDWNPTEVA